MSPSPVIAQAERATALLDRLRDAGAMRVDPVGWHYIEVLAERTRLQAAQVQAMLYDKLCRALEQLESRMATAPEALPLPAAPATPPSALALLLQGMSPSPGTKSVRAATSGWSGESPRVRQFRKQLHRISVQKQVSNAIAQAPLNAGPINSHMLVLRALGLMRDISPDYLNRFMSHVDTLLCLDEADKANPLPRKTAKKTGKAVVKPA